MDDGGDNDMLTPIVTSAANAVQKAGLIKDLLSPSAKILGAHLGKRTQAWIDGEPKRQAKNLDGHIAKLSLVENIEPLHEPTQRQFVALNHWKDDAKDIDPQFDEELSALWQSLLAGIVKNTADADELMSILKQMNRADAHAFLNIAETPNGARAPFLERFKRWGLVEGSLSMRAMQRAIVILGFAVIVGLFGIEFPDVMVGFNESPSSVQFRGITIIIAGSAVLLSAFYIFIDFTRVRLTPLGLSLLESSQRYLRTKLPDAPVNFAADAEPADEPAETYQPANQKTRRAKKSTTVEE